MNELKNKNIFKRSNWVLQTVLMVFVLVGILVAHPSKLYAQCVPVSATLAASGDDVTTIWFNGSLVGGFGYVSKGTGAAPTTIGLTPSQLALINTSGGVNCLAVQTQNTICCET